VNDFQLAGLVFDQGSAGFDPIAVVAIKHSFHIPHFGIVNVTADHAVDLAPPCLLGQREFVIADIFDGVFDFVFEIGRQRPVGETQLPASVIDPGIEA
jgi:hypothetical protein